MAKIYCPHIADYVSFHTPDHGPKSRRDGEDFMHVAIPYCPNFSDVNRNTLVPSICQAP